MIERFQELGTSVELLKSGRPRSSNTPEVRHKIKARLDRNQRHSLIKVTKDIKVMRESVLRIAKDVLKVKPFKLQKARLLTPTMMEVRLVRAKMLLDLAANH